MSRPSSLKVEERVGQCSNCHAYRHNKCTNRHKPTSKYFIVRRTGQPCTCNCGGGK